LTIINFGGDILITGDKLVGGGEIFNNSVVKKIDKRKTGKKEKKNKKTEERYFNLEFGESKGGNFGDSPF
jgi:hypothetical protein